MIINTCIVLFKYFLYCDLSWHFGMTNLGAQGGNHGKPSNKVFVRCLKVSPPKKIISLNLLKQIKCRELKHAIRGRNKFSCFYIDPALVVTACIHEQHNRL